MPKYLCLQRNVSTETSASPSPSQMQDLYARFNDWQETFKDHLADLGGRLGEGALIADIDVDGPLVEVKELIGGYMIVSADSLDEAVRVARACPGLVQPGSGVEVIEIHAP